MKEPISDIPEVGSIAGLKEREVDLRNAVPIQIKPNPQEPRDRVTLVDQLTHESVAHGADSFSVRGYRWLKSTEQPYERRMSVGTEWKPLSLGWLDETGCSMLILRNDEKPMATPDAFLEVCVGRLGTTENDLFPQRVIYPALSDQTCPAQSCAIWVRGVQEITYFTVFAVPR